MIWLYLYKCELAYCELLNLVNFFYTFFFFLNFPVMTMLKQPRTHKPGYLLKLHFQQKHTHAPTHPNITNPTTSLLIFILSLNLNPILTFNYPESEKKFKINTPPIYIRATSIIKHPCFVNLVLYQWKKVKYHFFFFI